MKPAATAANPACRLSMFERTVQELYDVVTLPGVRRPMALGFKTDEIRRVVSVGPSVQ
jgi:hypothetical protein